MARATAKLYGPFSSQRVADLHTWTHDGAAILAVVTEPNGTWRVMRIPADGGPATVQGLSLVDIHKTQPELRIAQQSPFCITVTPDGSQILFGAQTNGVVELRAFDNVLAVLNARK